MLLENRVRRTWFHAVGLGAQGGVETFDEATVQPAARSSRIAKTRIGLGTVALRIRGDNAKGLEHGTRRARRRTAKLGAHRGAHPSSKSPRLGGSRLALTGHAIVDEVTKTGNVWHIDTAAGFRNGRLTLARIDTDPIETLTVGTAPRR